MDSLKMISVLDHIEQLPHPSNDSEPIQGLPVLPGYRCNECGKLSQKRELIEKHFRQDHKADGEIVCTPEKVSLQQWCRMGNIAYWTTMDTDHMTEPIPHKISEREPSWEERMEKMERERLQRQKDGTMRMNERSHQDDMTPWLLRTKWPEMFQNKNLEVIG